MKNILIGTRRSCLLCRSCLSCHQDLSTSPAGVVYLASRSCLSCKQEFFFLSAGVAYLASTSCLFCQAEAIIYLACRSCLPYNQLICFRLTKKSSVRYPIVLQIHLTPNIYQDRVQIHPICSLKGLKLR